MYNPQVTPAKKDIEKGDKEDICESNTGYAIDNAIAAQDAVMNDPIVVGLQYCCCDTRNASICWFFVSIFLETAALIVSFASGAVNFIALFGSIFLLILSIQGLSGSVRNTKNYVMVGFAGFVLKAVLNLIGLIIIAISWESILNQMDVDYDDVSLNYGRIIFIIFGVAIVLFYSGSCSCFPVHERD